MVNLHTLERQIQQAILLNAVESYKRQHTGWPDNPAIKHAILADTFFSRPSLAIMAATMLVTVLVVVVFHPIWLVAATVTISVMAAGLIVEISWLWVNLANEQRQINAIAKHLPAKTTFSLNNIHDERLKAKLLKALRYWWLINDKISTLPPGPIQKRVTITHSYVTRWLETVYTLACQADKLLLDTIIRQDLQNVPAIIKRYEEMLLHEQDPALQPQLEQTLAHRRQQLQTLQSVQHKLKQVHYKLDGTLSALGMVYSQLILATEGEQQGTQISRLQADVTEEIDRLQDLIEAMDEVYQETNG